MSLLYQRVRRSSVFRSKFVFIHHSRVRSYFSGILFRRLDAVHFCRRHQLFKMVVVAMHGASSFLFLKHSGSANNASIHANLKVMRFIKPLAKMSRYLRTTMTCKIPYLYLYMTLTVEHCVVTEFFVFPSWIGCHCHFHLSNGHCKCSTHSTAYLLCRIRY